MDLPTRLLGLFASPFRLLGFACHLSLLLAACASAGTAAVAPTPAPTPTLLGTVNPVPTSLPAPTPQRNVCFFRTATGVDAGLYRFDWQNFTFTLDTRIGPVVVDGPRTLAAGPRQLILTHGQGRPTSFGVAVNFDVGGTLIADPADGTQEVRDWGGTVLVQNMTDPVGDAGGLPAYLDIVRVERTFGYYPNSLVRVYLAGVRSSPQIWTFQKVGVALGNETYTRQTFADGRIVLSVADSQGRVKEWPGPVTVEGNALTFALQTGVDQAVAALTATSGGGGDVAGPYPKGAMQALWEGAKKNCP